MTNDGQHDHAFQYLEYDGKCVTIHCTDSFSVKVELPKSCSDGRAVGHIIGACNDNNIEDAYPDTVLNRYKEAVQSYHLRINKHGTTEKKVKSPSNEHKDSKRVITRRVPYWRLPDVAFEAIHVAGKPAFLCYDGSKFSTVTEMITSEDDKTREIVEPVEDIPYEKYDFPLEEIRSLSTSLPADAREKAYQRILETITPYQDTEESQLRVDAAGILLSYNQDKLDSVPYIAKIGAPEAGKSRSLKMVSWLAYRPLMAIDMTAANVYRFYGQDIQGAGTIIHDEIDDANIDQDKALRAIYNAGYQYGAKVPRISGEHQEKQSYYNCFGIKWFGGTDMPYSKTFRSRCIMQKFMQGIPEKIDITDEDKEVFRKVRKELLVLRLLSAFDKFEPVNTGLTGRSRELYTPLLAVVQGTKWYDELLEPLLQLDRERHEEDRESKQAYVARSVIGCWLDAASREIGKNITGPLDQQLEAIKQALFVSNDAVIANMGLTEVTNDKGRKILVSDDLPFVLSRSEVGRIQSENLKGQEPRLMRTKEKVVRGHSFTLETIRSLYRRYIVTLDAKSNACNTSMEGADPKNDSNLCSDHAQNESKKERHPAPASVTSVTSVTSEAAKKQSANTIHEDSALHSNSNLFLDLASAIEKKNREQKHTGIITHKELHKELVDSGKWTAGEATQTIRDALKDGTLIERELYEYTLPSRDIDPLELQRLEELKVSMERGFH